MLPIAGSEETTPDLGRSVRAPDGNRTRMTSLEGSGYRCADQPERRSGGAPGRPPCRCGRGTAGRLFANTAFSNERIAAAAANCKIPLPTQQSLQAMWQTSDSSAT
jgi:hypothetical protein